MRHMFLISFVLLYNVFAFTYSVELTEQEVQKKLEEKMPLSKKKFFINMTLSNPVVKLSEIHGRIEFKFDADVVFPGGIKGHGVGVVDGNLDYDNKTGEFYFTNPKIKYLQIDNISLKYQLKIKKLTEIIVQEYLNKFSIYKLDRNKLSHKVIELTLDSIEVKSKKLIINLKI